MASININEVADTLAKEISKRMRGYYDKTDNLSNLRFYYNFPAYAKQTNLAAEFAHLVEEAAEANSAFNERMGVEDVVVEVMDVIHQCETILRMMDGKRFNHDCKRLVIAKNKYRGYYEPEADR